MSKKSSFNVRLLIPIGLLLVIAPTLIGHYVPVSDFLRGLLFGVGIALEILGVIRIKRVQKVDSSS